MADFLRVLLMLILVFLLTVGLYFLAEVPPYLLAFIGIGVSVFIILWAILGWRRR